jgi:hypothetical protein
VRLPLCLIGKPLLDLTLAFLFGESLSRLAGQGLLLMIVRNHPRPLRWPLETP